MSTETTTLAAGCFWCIEAVFDGLAGIDSVESGYIGGHVPDPTYKEVCGGATGHAEAVRITFDSDVVSYDEILDIFFEIHDPTQLNRQGNDVGTQYRSAIFPHSPAQEAAARAAIVRAQAVRNTPVVTTVEPLSDWYVAEDYHQEYFEREGAANPYCQIVVAPKLAKFRQRHAARLKDGVTA
ncbi:peptide-methionine (S)-S-oxide reductase MsrA [Sphingomonas sp. SUN039]|uniref:peptide-methionine (S)-S-oxide reductase MsrA n=1 Tax=Sphingomonas sp. SUN039 TaxID=2937787 RepID=UPI0021645646|nr:peptide-methionine (S)-S-oxide reductase MsrA [Sphingomonas sp. SUN039]UVO52863.1 peptide-methionine (S)-S-oxide reductase MsrA [Sphingomonas sp. SUN039]